MPSNRVCRVTTVFAVAAAIATACSSHPGPAGAGSTSVKAVSSAVPPVSGPRTIEPFYNPAINPAEFTTTIDNPYYPLIPGTRFIYEGVTPDGREHNVVEVTSETKTVMGVTTRVVHDSVSVNSQPAEETFDWFAQDSHGNVWYFGEQTTTSAGTKGSFEAGINSALPGIVMLGAPTVGDQYRQEYAKGQAEDLAKVLSLNGTETVSFGGLHTGLVVTEDTNPLDPSSIEHKYFAKGIGLMLSANVAGPTERIELTGVQKF